MIYCEKYWFFHNTSPFSGSFPCFIKQNRSSDNFISLQVLEFFPNIFHVQFYCLAKRFYESGYFHENCKTISRHTHAQNKQIYLQIIMFRSTGEDNFYVRVFHYVLHEKWITMHYSPTPRKKLSEAFCLPGTFKR